ncbi:sugar transferase [Chitinophaga oryziterrae]|uniref:Sugar transferase n=1 Tax=Chitinophaga oryziterrae TaxID=1031224 RepID=A0A6N8JD99_9BACT|nr:sugar transferase [Chitinophaga oryziterrae]MVT42092.1 sugar transferase [Chitinophaga oryziterrae]
MYRSFIKRSIDISITILALIGLSPIILVCGLIIYFQDFGPIVFKQKRVGKNGRIFLFFKFRSMPVNTPNVQSRETDKLKITPFGKIIRRTNIDELPQLFNILKGDMSIVGPRPPIPSQTNLIEMRRENGALDCRPGLTGWAQVNAYDFMPEEQKARFDGEYAADISISMDLKVILKTFVYLTKKPPTY